MALSKDMKPFSKSFGRVFWNNQFQVKIEVPTQKMFPGLEGKVAVVTSASSGLGFEAGRQLLTLGVSRLILAVRSLERGKATAKELGPANQRATIDVWSLDMESYPSIQSFVNRCDTQLSRIDFVVLNAGLSPLEFNISNSTGHETTIQVNHLSTALLAALLLPVLKAKAIKYGPARLTAVNSVMAHLCKFPNRGERPLLPSFDDTEVTPWDAQERYGVSKLLSQLLLVELVDKVKPEDVIINMVDPGLTKGTLLSRDAKGILGLALKGFIGIAGRPVERGAATYIDALLGHGKESHGCFLMNTDISPLATFYYSAEGKAATKQIWEETLEELSFANVKDVISAME